MSQDRIGVWLIGALGGVSTTVAVGLAALQKKLSGTSGLVSELPVFSGTGLADWDQFVIGGNEIRESTYRTEAQVLLEKSRVFSPDLLEQVSPILDQFDTNIRPGTLINTGERIESFASDQVRSSRGEAPWTAIERIRADIEDFRKRGNYSHVIVVNLASTEPPLPNSAQFEHWSELEKILRSSATSPVPASTIYAVAAFLSKCSFVNFTPSIGSDIPALDELARKMGQLHVGRDGKTGETLMKSVLAPMFAARNLQVLSWVGHNIFGNMDGKVLDDPVNKANKVRSKDHLLTEILGYKPQTLVSIEYIESLGDWKTAWDHIHYQGFLDTKMILQFTWQGCDSLLAAPLVLDLIRFTEREHRQGKSGIMKFLASFFKSPMGCAEQKFHAQYEYLLEWASSLKGK